MVRWISDIALVELLQAGFVSCPQQIGIIALNSGDIVPEGGDFLAITAGMETFPGFLGFAGRLGGGVDPASGG